jgi:hypothetical protein
MYIDEIEKFIPVLEEILSRWEDGREQLNKDRLEFYRLRAEAR